MAKKQGKKKKDKVIEPQYYVSATNMRTYNYKVYHMPVYEKILFFLLAFAVGAGVGYLFYGGIGKDAYGQPTKITYCLNVIIPGIIGIIAGKMIIPDKNGKCDKETKKQAEPTV